MRHFDWMKALIRFLAGYGLCGELSVLSTFDGRKGEVPTAAEVIL
jgi:hypothetical protein